VREAATGTEKKVPGQSLVVIVAGEAIVGVEDQL